MSLFRSDNKYADMFKEFESGGASGSGGDEDDDGERLEATGEYTEDEINALARGGKLRGHIPGVGRVLPSRATSRPSGASGSGECGDDEESGDDEDDDGER
ncbi:hypothetical protein Tco_0451954 [Tanacetum coccineum]